VDRIRCEESVANEMFYKEQIEQCNDQKLHIQSKIADCREVLNQEKIKIQHVKETTIKTNL